MNLQETVTIFVAGTHGVGKGTLCKILAPEVNAFHVTASSLIRSAKKLAETKFAPEINDNQIHLIEEFRRVSLKNPRIILDGHFCLLNEFGEVESLPIQLFKDLQIDLIIIAFCSPDIIYERLSARDGSNNQLSEAMISSAQKKELLHSNHVSNKLSIPILYVDTSVRQYDIKEVVEFVAREGKPQSTS